MKQPLHVLHIEDSPEDYELIQQLLLSNGIACEMSRVETRAEVFDALEHSTVDLILSDCKLPNFSGLQALEIAQALKPEVPFVFLSGTIGEETAIESLRNGATDYVLKNRLSRLVPAVRRALEEAEERTLRRQLQQRLREAGRLEAISTLSNGIAHDFNNILTIILGHASLLGVDYRRPERVQELARTITQAAQRGAEVVEQLMAFARKSDGHTEPTNLNRCVQDKMGLLKEMVPDHVEFSFVPAASLPEVMADAHKLERILLNLIRNSVDSMPEGGNLTLSTHLVGAGDLPDALPKPAPGDYTCLKVTDTGMGMDAKTREHVFEPFFTTKERGRGTGLGLPVVYGLMQALNGYIKLESELGQGTTLSLFFPAIQPLAAKAPPATLGPDPALCGTETILVVEDEPDVGFYLETILQSYGYHVLLAHDHEEALMLFRENCDRIQLVFSDIGLPKVDGITLCGQLKTLKSELPIILASGYSPKEFKGRIDELQSEAFLAKPYHTHHILKMVRKVLDGARAVSGA